MGGGEGLIGELMAWDRFEFCLCNRTILAFFWSVEESWEVRREE